MSHRNFADVPVMRKPDQESVPVVKKLQKFIEKKHQIKFDDFWDFHKWSVDQNGEFWAAVWDFTGVISSKSYDQVIDPYLPIYETSAWFKGAKLNYAENLLKYRDDKVALITLGEDKEIEEVTYAQLFEDASLYAAAFRKCGLQKGDVVVCYMSNRKEPVIAMEAAVSIGAIWTGALPLLGSQAVLSRFQPVKPKFLVTVDRFVQGRKQIEMLPKIKDIAEGIPSLEKVIIVPSNGNLKLPNISDIRNSCFLEEFLELGRKEDGSVPTMQFEQVSFSHPVFISFTSGTSGPPKALVHGSGALMAIVKDFGIHLDTTRESVWLSVSPVGWATWNMFSSLLFLGTRVVLFESSPFYLSPTYFWDLVEELKMTHLLLVASVVDQFQKQGYLPTERHSLSALKYINSGGSIVKPENYDFIYGKVKRDIVFSASYGTTELMGISLVMETTLPIHRGEIPATALGCCMETVDKSGNRIVGEIGELVLSNSVPSLPIGIWGDSDGSSFREKYFSKYPGKFNMGDLAIRNPITKGWLIFGRSDETLKQRGCRFGSVEIYNVVDKFQEVSDSFCVSKYNEDMDESAVLFLKMKDGYTFNDELVQRIREAIERELTYRHVPDFILEAPDIPYNINGKKMEIAVKKIINKLPHNVDQIKNPESLKYFYDIPEILKF